MEDKGGEIPNLPQIWDLAIGKDKDFRHTKHYTPSPIAYVWGSLVTG